MKSSQVFFLASMSCIWTGVVADQPNPPAWPASVTVFAPTDSADDINNAVQAAYRNNGGQSPCNNGQFSSYRYAFLFKPGTYNSEVSVPVGYYTSVIGLGQSPSDTQIPNVYCEQGCASHKTGALDTFWRSAENFSTSPTRFPYHPFTGVMQWAVSQAAPLRRIQMPAPQLGGNPYGVQLWENQDGNEGFCSGGFMADCNITGVVDLGSQQQWLCRNCEMVSTTGGAWNLVYVGCTGSIPSTTEASGYVHGTVKTTVKSTPVIAEKPYIRFDDPGYSLIIPGIEYNKIGPTTDFVTNTTAVSFNNVYVVANPEIETAADINTQISAGNHVILTPGIYSNLNGTIEVSQPITILGIGFPTLISSNGLPCIKVHDGLAGVRIGGILLQAGATTSPTLLQWGDTNTSAGYSFLYDCFARVGGPENPSVNPTSSTLMVQIKNGNVICDNLWLWRADHTITGDVVDGQNPCTTGLQVIGDDVIAYGLAVEHTLGDLTQWYGNNGQVFFYQSEFPYDVTQSNYGDKGYVSYRVNDPSGQYPPVTSHNAYGIGIYCFFDPTRNTDGSSVTVSSAIGFSPTTGIVFTNALTRYLTGSGGIANVINDLGGNVNASQMGPFCVPTFTGIDQLLINDITSDD